MGKPVLICGESGSGKSRSIKNLDPKSTFIINVNRKDLPFKGWKLKYTKFTKENKNGNMVLSDDPEKIIKTIQYIDSQRPEVNVGIIDDAQYIMANEFMRRSKEKSFEKFTEIGEHYWKIIWECTLSRENMIWFFLSHVETNDKGISKAKTIGKLLDDKICIEGMFTIVLNTLIEDGKYFFETQSNGSNTSKSPEGMFEEIRIPNDLEFVKNQIIKYEMEA
jgi:ABC-type oligopeptide transport system ATPase subunit